MAEIEHDTWLRFPQCCGAQADGTSQVEACNKTAVAVALDGMFYPHGYGVCADHVKDHPILPLKDLIEIAREQAWVRAE